MLLKAVEQRWPIDPRFRAAVINDVLSVIADKKATRRHKNTATRLLLLADKINLEAEKADQPQLHLHQHQQPVDFSRVPTSELERLEAELVSVINRHQAAAGSH